MGIFNKKKKDDTDNVPTNSFNDILNGLQYAIDGAQEILQNHQIQNLLKLFDSTVKDPQQEDAENIKVKDKGRSLLSQPIKIGEKVVDVPLIALISHHYLAMDNVEIKFKARVGSVETQTMKKEGLAGNLLTASSSQANLNMQMSGIKQDANDVMEVCVNFKVQETPESISRIIDECVKNI